jgi:hypothetical protein
MTIVIVILLVLVTYEFVRRAKTFTDRLTVIFVMAMVTSFVVASDL